MSAPADTIAWPLIGHEAAQAAFLNAHETGRLHHGWLVEGPSGIGKARLAQKIAAYMLGAECAPGTLDSHKEDRVVQKIEAQAHPDLRRIWRQPDEKGKVKQDIPVDAIRELNSFFSLRAALGGWRVGIIDSLDELNQSGSNALLKTLEEPPENCLLILISHRTRSILPTIRSRCRLLRLSALSDADTRKVLDASNHAAAKESMTQSLARGRPGRGLNLASPTGLAASNAARNYLRGLPKPSDAAISDVIAKCGIDEIAFAAFQSEVFEWLAQKSLSHPAYAQCWLEVSRLVAETAEINMDRTQASAKLLAKLQAAAQTS